MAENAGSILAAEAVTRRFPLARSALLRLVDQRATVALDDVSLSIAQGDTLGVVGESGSGKTTLARLMVGLDRPDAGRILFEGRPLSELSPSERTRLRAQVQLVFQGAHTSLNPRKTVRRSLSEAMLHAPALGELEALLADVALGPEMLSRYPHELSGGQKQRIGIARALARRPALLIADEPTSALDVSVQSEIVSLLAALQRRELMALVVISHDLGLVSALCQRLVVMYAGRVVESGPSKDILAAPMHPYTRRLIEAVPRGLSGRGRAVEPLIVATARHAGCPFEPRCGARLPMCSQVMPPAVEVNARVVRCHLASPTQTHLRETGS